MVLCEAMTMVPVLYHGTCEDSAANLVQNGWRPNAWSRGGNQGQRRYLYLTTGYEDALWFAEQNGCISVVEVHDVPIDHLIPDPEDATGDTVAAELAASQRHGLPAKLALVRPLPASHFRASRQSRFPLVNPNQIGASLYHGTSIPRAALIIAQDVLKGNEDAEGADFAGVSFTDQLVRAAGYALDATHHLATDFGASAVYGSQAGIATDPLPDQGAVLAMQSSAILRDFQVRSVSWQGHPPEERVIGDVAPLSRYLTRILLDPAAIHRWIVAFEANVAPSKPHAFEWVSDEINDYLVALRQLAQHPKLAKL